MLLTQNYRPRQQLPPFQNPHHFSISQNQHFPSASAPQTTATTEQQQKQQQQHHASPLYADVSGIDIDLDLAAATVESNSLSSSPVSTQSLLSQYSNIQPSTLSTFDSIPAISIPRSAHHLGGGLVSGPQVGFEEPSLFANTDSMQMDSWMGNTGPMTPKSVSRLSHHRESSLSSLGSAGPASPYSHNTSNPQIAVTDSMGEGFHGIPVHDDFSSHYQLAPKSFPSVTHDTFYANYPTYTSAMDATAGSGSGSGFAAAHKQRSDRGLLPPPPDFPAANHSRSRPVSVASSIASDSPATPSGEAEDDRRRRNAGFNNTSVPKLDRTMTDIYGDELYSPSFSLTSASPAHVPASPGNELFAQRLQAVNSQHLSAAQSPLSATSRERSPFRQGSPLAPSASLDFPTAAAMANNQMRFGSAQAMREQHKAVQDAQVLQQQMARVSDSGTPQTISPKDAVLEFPETDGEANFPLFPQQGSTGFGTATMVKSAASSQPSFDSLPLDSTFSYVQQMPTGIQVPQQYPFVAAPRQSSSSMASMTGASSLAPSRVSSADSGAHSELGHGSSSPHRPAVTSADGGTYTCTYHGCTMRFDTPAQLQRHKREGHRQAHGLNTTRRAESVGMTSSLLNSQAGPHRCDRINPSTGKPCNTVFSRPYDLTRHEDTIHNARKQKVRCDLCTDEKTFSRADALTRHYRVCHPDVEFPGKHRRRGGN